MSSRALQVLGSLLVAAAIVAITIAVVTAQFGPTSAAELESLEERQEQRLEQQEERREERLEQQEELREEREERREELREG